MGGGQGKVAQTLEEVCESVRTLGVRCGGGRLADWSSRVCTGWTLGMNMCGVRGGAEMVAIGAGTATP